MAAISSSRIGPACSGTGSSSIVLAIVRALVTFFCTLMLGCASSAKPPAAEADELATVRTIHGGAGPWVVAGYRMGAYALHALELPRGSFDLEVVHYSPAEVQFSCIADGAAAATGASLGKLNLDRIDAPGPETRTVYRSRASGRSITLRVTPSFAQRFRDVPRAELAARGREVLQLRDDEVFEVVP
jgi:formylmethanofuran dehydrogenase subunit E